MHALATTSCLISFSKALSEWKCYGIISDNGLSFYLVLFPNLWDIKRMVKRNNFFLSQLSMLWAERSTYVFHKQSKTLRSRQVRLKELPFQGTICLPKRSVFFIKLLEPASLAVIHLTDAPILSKEQICISTTSEARKRWNSRNWEPSGHWQTHWHPWKETDRELPSMLARWKRADWWKHNKTRVLNKDSVKFPVENGNRSWKQWFY